RDGINKTGDLKKRAKFLDIIHQRIDKKGAKDYLQIIETIRNDGAALGTTWLQGLVNEINHETAEFIPALMQ
ncbi:MAG TPA: hypothetical protein VMW42_11370, partial [Desulfatiglandales bacterium]|nr:hypothetical protein [Desulfatiglandales bacterium]